MGSPLSLNEARPAYSGQVSPVQGGEPKQKAPISLGRLLPSSIGTIGSNAGIEEHANNVSTASKTRTFLHAVGNAVSKFFTGLDIQKIKEGMSNRGFFGTIGAGMGLILGAAVTSLGRIAALAVAGSLGLIVGSVVTTFTIPLVAMNCFPQEIFEGITVGAEWITRPASSLGVLIAGKGLGLDGDSIQRAKQDARDYQEISAGFGSIAGGAAGFVIGFLPGLLMGGVSAGVAVGFSA